MTLNTVLEIVDYGAWNGGTLEDNSIFESKGMFFKGNKPVNNETIEERIGVRTRIAAAPDEKIGVLAMQDLLETTDIDPTRIKLLIGATNVGDDKYEKGPFIKSPFECPNSENSPGFILGLQCVWKILLSRWFLEPLEALVPRKEKRDVVPILTSGRSIWF